MVSSQIAPFIISGNTPVGVCCACDLYDCRGNLIEHIEQYTLYKCQNSRCNCWSCKEHLSSCGFCYGCCAEEHGLGSHI